MSYGLSAASIVLIKEAILSVSGITDVILYGSRALGTFREGSDIDLTLKGDVSPQVLAKLIGKLEDANLPYKFDLSIYNNINNSELREHIDRVGILFYTNPNTQNALI